MISQSDFADSPKHKKLPKKDNNGTLRDKEFLVRNSLLDDMMQSKHIITVYRMAISILFGLILHTAAYEYFHKGKINVGQNLIIKGLRKCNRFVALWMFMFLFNLLIYYSFKYWATVRTVFLPKSLKLKLWDYSWLVLLTTYYPGWLYFTTKVSRAQDMSFFLVIIALSEGIRMLMKVHAFVRSNVPKILSYKHHTDQEVPFPKFSQFMYFLWAPTLVYRDTYPRTKTIRWNYVVVKIAEFIAALFWMSVFIERYIIINFKDYGIKPYTWSDVVVITIANASAGLMLMFTTFYIKLHLWMGAFAEICRFGDRMFYQDWWTSTNYERYYRTWNVVIYDWLYTYVYKDFYEIITPGNKIAAKIMVFFLSAIVHDYILVFSFGFFIPNYFILFFMCGSVMTFVKMKPDVIANIFLLYTIGLGSSITVSVYGMEYYARQNCPIETPTLLSFLIPRFVSCGLN